MNKKKLGITLISIPFIMLLISIFFRILYDNRYFFSNYIGSWMAPILQTLSDIGIYIAILLFFFSPLLFGLGIYNLIKYNKNGKLLAEIKEIYLKIRKQKIFLLIEKKYKKISPNKVSKRRNLIGKIILLGVIVPIVLLLIWSYIYSGIAFNIRQEVREEYRDKCPTYVIKDYEKDEEEVRLKPTLIGEYEFKPDEYVWYWDETDQGYYYQDTYIDIPGQYIPKEIYTVTDGWRLKNNYILDLKCNPIDLRRIDMSESSTCTISYNNKVVSTDVRHDVFCYYESSKTCYYKAGITLYSNAHSSGNTEYLFLISRLGDSHNKLSVFKLDNGEYRPLIFKYEENGENVSSSTFAISGTMFELYGIEKYGMFDFMMDGDMELVTFFSEPTMGVNNNIYGIHSIWNVEEDGLYLKKTVMELIEDWETEVEDGI